MGKLTAIKTKSIFQSLLNDSSIDEQSIHFILDTGLIYTHGTYINGAAYGTEANGAVNLSIAGVTKALSLSTHTHSTYLEKNSNIDIGSYIIKSGNNELLKWASSKLILGSPTYITGTAHTTRNSTNYDILDTGNFSVVAKTSTNVSLQNVATIKYGSSTFLIDYAKRINGAYTFDNITYTSIGTTNVNNQQYGIITMYTDGSTPVSYALIRADIPNGKLEYRTSGSTAWKTIVTGALPTVFVGSGSSHASGLVPDPGATAGTAKFLCEDGTWKTPTYTSDTNTWRNILVNGTLRLSNAINSGGLDIINGTNTTVEWTSASKLKINAVDTWIAWKGATDSANGTAGYMPAPTSAQRGQFLRGDGSWVSLNNYSLPTASNSTLGGVKTGAAITDTTGYTAVAIKDGVIYYKDTNTTYSFSNLLFLQTSGTNLMTYNSQATKTILAGSNITFTHSNNILTITANDTTYSTVSKSAAGLCPALPNETTTTKYLRLDGSWVTPPNDNTWKAANASQEGYVPKSTANKILRANGDGVLYWGDDANTTYTFYNLLFKNSEGTTVDTYKPITSPTKTLKAGSNVTISAASNIITIASTNTWNANAVGVAGYVAAPTKAANANMTWQTDADGNPAWRASNNHSHSYLPLSGGTMTGGVTCTTSGANLKWGNITIYGGGSNGGSNSIYIGDDVTLGDCNVSGSFGMKSTGANAGFRFFNSSGTSIGGIQSTAGVLQWINSSGTAYNILDSSNSSVSKSGETLTVKINGTSQSLTNTNTWTPWAGATDSANGTAGYMPAPTSAQRTQFLRGDGTWVSLNNYSLPTASSSTLGGVKTGSAISDTSGYTACPIKDGVIYYKDTNTTYSFYNLAFLNGDTVVDTYKPTTSPSKTLKAGTNVTISAASNVITISSSYTNTLYKLTLNGTVKGTTGGTDLGSFYAVATSDTTTANQVWMRNSSNNGYGWRTLGSHAFDSTTYATPDTTTTLTRASGNLTKDTWSDAGTFADSVAEGTWVVSFTVDGSIYSGVFSRKKSDTMSEEITLHAAGTSARRIYARTTGNKFQIVTADDTFNPGAITFNFRKLI